MGGPLNLIRGITSPKTSEKGPKGAEDCLKLAENGSKSCEFSFEWLSFLSKVQWGKGVKITSTPRGIQNHVPQTLTPNNYKSLR